MASIAHIPPELKQAGSQPSVGSSSTLTSSSMPGRKITSLESSLSSSVLSKEIFVNGSKVVEATSNTESLQSVISLRQFLEERKSNGSNGSIKDTSSRLGQCESVKIHRRLTLASELLKIKSSSQAALNKKDTYAVIDRSIIAGDRWTIYLENETDTHPINVLTFNIKRSSFCIYFSVRKDEEMIALLTSFDFPVPGRIKKDTLFFGIHEYVYHTYSSETLNEAIKIFDMFKKIGNLPPSEYRAINRALVNKQYKAQQNCLPFWC